MRGSVEHIAIVGGGTAGWLVAMVLQRAFSARAKKQSDIRISLIESPNIPTVGVGEGSTALLRQVLQSLEIDEAEFLKETNATLKFGIRHQGWSEPGKGYFGPIDDPNLLVPKPEGAATNWLHTARIASGNDVESMHLFTWLMKGKKSAFAKADDGTEKPISAFHHAYHFDQAKLGKFLATKAESVEHILAEVSELIRDSSSGDITQLVLENGQNVDVDFVVDCTGFRRAIVSKLGSSWHSYSDILPLNKAMPFWLEHKQGEDINPYTLAHAQSAGWMWGIPTYDRMGCGYVFSDAHLSADEAKAEIETTLGQQIEPRGLISIDPGRLNEAWVGNCVAMGLAQSFLEPLEATSIHGTLVQALLLSNLEPSELVGEQSAQHRDRYNNVVASQVDDFAEFINLHYWGDRSDSPFWKDMADNRRSPRMLERLNVWAEEPIERKHFGQFPGGLPHVEEQLFVPVLDGLKLTEKAPSKKLMAMSPKVRAHARRTLESLIKEFAAASRKAVSHKDYLRALHNA